MWRPTTYTDDDFAQFRAAFEGSSLQAVAIHAIYLINCASKEPEVKRNSQTALEHSLRVGDAVGAFGVVLHAGARKGEPRAPSIRRAGRMIRRALEDSDRCPILLENTAGTEGPLGRDFDELAELMDAAEGNGRLGACLDCCHLLASGFEIRTADALEEVIDEFDAKVGLERLRCLHVNDSKIPLGGNRDSHATLGEGEIGEDGLSVFLSAPRFEALPAVLETGRERQPPEAGHVELARRLRKRGLAARRRRR
jgi:deoxyribonuclease-4